MSVKELLIGLPVRVTRVAPEDVQKRCPALIKSTPVSFNGKIGTLTEILPESMDYGDFRYVVVFHSHPGMIPGGLEEIFTTTTSLFRSQDLEPV